MPRAVLRTNMAAKRAAAGRSVVPMAAGAGSPTEQAVRVTGWDAPAMRSARTGKMRGALLREGPTVDAAAKCHLSLLR